MNVLTMQGKNIDELISYLEAIIQQTIAEGNPMGYFAALYHQVTVTVKDGITQGCYSDGKRMELPDVIFANRFLEAYTQFHENRPCTAS